MSSSVEFSEILVPTAAEKLPPLAVVVTFMPILPLVEPETDPP